MCIRGRRGILRMNPDGRIIRVVRHGLRDHARGQRRIRGQRIRSGGTDATRGQRDEKQPRKGAVTQVHPPTHPRLPPPRKRRDRHVILTRDITQTLAVSGRAGSVAACPPVSPRLLLAPCGPRPGPCSRSRKQPRRTDCSRSRASRTAGGRCCRVAGNRRRWNKRPRRFTTSCERRSAAEHRPAGSANDGRPSRRGCTPVHSCPVRSPSTQR